jgi:hypothetical protein
MLTPNQEKWLKALESGEFNQTTGQLENLHPKPAHCCLGVACVLAEKDGAKVERYTDHYGPDYDKRIIGGSLIDHEDVMNWLGLRSPAGLQFVDGVLVGKSQSAIEKGYESLTYMNDHGKTFKEIAAIIRAHPERFFVTSEPNHRSPT